MAGVDIEVNRGQDFRSLYTSCVYSISVISGGCEEYMCWRLESDVAETWYKIVEVCG